MDKRESGTFKKEEGAGINMPLEIEKKFVVRSLPDNLDGFPHVEIKQGYVSISEDGTEVRLRKKGNRLFQTVKSGAGKIRSEIEIEISEDQFNSLWKTTEGRRLEKIRYNIPHEGQVIELDIYQGSLNGFVSAEIEFDSQEASEKFTAPDWFGKDVTEDRRYKNQSLALHGLPKEAPSRREKKKEKLDIPLYSLEEGVIKLAEMIREKMLEKEGPIIVEIAGGSASGKTSTVTEKLRKMFGDDAVILSMDDYYRGRKFMAEEAERGNTLNWDQPEALNLELLKEHLAQLRNGKSIQKPVYSFKTGELEGTVELKPSRVIIVEGLFALNETVKDEGDIKAFVELGTHGRILRRLFRDVMRTGQKPADILGYFAETVEPMHDKYIENTKKNSDIILNMEYNPAVESERSGLHEIQLKFRVNLDMELLRKAGAERLGTITQVDTYYDPKDRNLASTGEILRIREEYGHRILTYKGPKIETAKFRERSKFEFEIDKDVENKFINIYGDRTKVIEKERILYQLDGIVFSLDVVSKIEDGVSTDLGKFIEIRSTTKASNNEKLDEVLLKLGLKVEDGIRESYFEM